MNNILDENYAGLDPDEVVSKISGSGQFKHVQKLPVGSIVTMDYRLDRVRVYYDPKSLKVVSVRNG